MFKAMESTKSICTWLENSVSSTLRDIISSGSSQFTLVSSPEQAEVIIFGEDIPSYIRQTTEFKQYPEKCIMISEADEPSYFLPSCYTSNRRSWLSYNRAQTIPYFLSQRAIPNPFINDFTGAGQRRYLYSFRGGSTSWLRKRLFKLEHKRSDVCIEEANHYHHWNHKESYADKKTVLQRQYADLIKQSSFFLCPRGVGVSSIRLFEVMQAGRVPVIIADDWIPVAGVPWATCSLQLMEKDLSNLDQIIRTHEHEADDLGLRARQAWEDFCSPDVHAEFLAKSIRIIQQNRNQQREQVLHYVYPALETISKGKTKAVHLLKYLILRGFALTGRKFPYSLNRPIDEQIRNMNS